MGMNSLQNLLDCLEQGSNKIEVEPALRREAYRSLERMMNFRV
jgi:quinolinate synthase